MDKTEIQKQIVARLPTPPHGILNLAMRVGKTKIALDLIKKNNYKKVLWVTVSEDLRDKGLPEEFKKWGHQNMDYTIVCWQSLHLVKGYFDIIILDEIQKATPANTLNLKEALKYGCILGLTGTLPKDEEKLLIYRSLGLKPLITINIEEAVKLNLISNYRIKVVTTELNDIDKTIKGGSKKAPFLTTEKKNYDYLTKKIEELTTVRKPVPTFYYLNRARAIYNSPSKLKLAKYLIDNLEGRTLVFSGSIEMAEKLSNSTYHSKTDSIALEKFEREESNLLVCVNSGGIGRTFTNIDNLIITQVNSNKMGDSTQKAARALVPREGHIPNIYILCLEDTSDKKWVKNVLTDFDNSKITIIKKSPYEI